MPKTHAIPASKCYACNAKATGVTLHNGAKEAACERHADPTIKAAFLCIYCDGPNPTSSVDGMYAHRKCHKRAVAA
jgi:hypothetical protein